MRPAASARQRSPPQHSSAFMHGSPITGTVGDGAGRLRAAADALGPGVAHPGATVASVAQRSCSGWQPGARAQRFGPSAEGAQRPEQQSLSSMHSASAGRQPGSA